MIEAAEKTLKFTWAYCKLAKYILTLISAYFQAKRIKREIVYDN
jgi:hypothetical protein